MKTQNRELSLNTFLYFKHNSQSVKITQSVNTNIIYNIKHINKYLNYKYDNLNNVNMISLENNSLNLNIIKDEDYYL